MCIYIYIYSNGVPMGPWGVPGASQGACPGVPGASPVVPKQLVDLLFVCVMSRFESMLAFCRL